MPLPTVSPYQASYTTTQINGSRPQLTAAAYPTLYTIGGQRLAVLRNAFDAKISEQILDTENGQEILDFNLPAQDINASLIDSEMQIRFGGSVFRIRTIDDGTSDNGETILVIHCEALWYDLGTADAILVNPGVTSPTTAINTICAGTGWVAGSVVAVSGGTYTVSQRATPLAALRDLPGVFGGELWFDNVNRTVNLVSLRGDQSGNRLYIRGSNLQSSKRTRDTTTFASRVRPVGANNIDISSVNGGLPYIDDYSFFDSRGAAHRVVAALISNDQITSPTALLAWGRAQLGIMSQPKLTYTVNVAQLNTETTPGLGDRVRVVDKSIGLNTFSRVVQRDHYPLEPNKTSLQINTAAYTLNNVITPGNSLSGAGDKTGQNFPNAPASVTIITNQGLSVDGTFFTYGNISWPAVTTNVDGSTLFDLNNYEVQYSVDGGAWVVLGRTADTAAQTAPFHAQASIVARVRAWTASGNPGGWTQSSVIATKDTLAPLAPSAPTVSNRLPLALEIFWNGLDNQGHPMPRDFAYVEAHVFATTGFNPTTGTNALTGDAATFDTSTGSWQNFLGSAATMTWTSIRSHTGSGGSLRITTTAATQSGANRVASPVIPKIVNPGDNVPLSLWVYPSVTANLILAYDVYDSNNVYLGTGYATAGSTGALTCPANTWTQLYYVAPSLGAGAGSIDISLAFQTGSSVPIGATIDIDDAIIATAGQTLSDHISNYVGGVAVATQLSPALTYWCGLRAVDRSGNISPMSALVSGSVAQLSGPHYGTLSIDDSKIGSLSAGKITVGVLNADVTVASRIKTADVGARVELNSTGIHAWNAAGTETVTISSLGSASIIGTISTAVDTAGRKIVLGIGATSEPQLSFMPQTGATYYNPPNIAQYLGDDLALALNSGLSSSTDQSLSLVLSNGSAGAYTLSTISGVSSTLAVTYGTTHASYHTGGWGYTVPLIGAQGIVTRRAVYTGGAFAFVTHTYGPTMAVALPMVTSTMETTSNVASQSVGAISSTTFRQFSSTFTNSASSNTATNYVVIADAG